jgi:hypothetical protein
MIVLALSLAVVVVLLILLALIAGSAISVVTGIVGLGTGTLLSRACR